MLFAQIDQAVNAVDKIRVSEGIFAALFVALLGVFLFAAWKLGNAYLMASTANNERIAKAVESQAETNVKIGDISLAIQGKLEDLGTDVERLKKATHLAITAMKIPDEASRHAMIDQAKDMLMQ